MPELAQGRLLDLVYRLLKEEADRVQKVRACVCGAGPGLPELHGGAAALWR